jgi:hypothetical protein
MRGHGPTAWRRRPATTHAQHPPAAGHAQAADRAGRARLTAAVPEAAMPGDTQ